MIVRHVPLFGFRWYWKSNNRTPRKATSMYESRIIVHLEGELARRGVWLLDTYDYLTFAGTESRTIVLIIRHVRLFGFCWYWKSSNRTPRKTMFESRI